MLDNFLLFLFIFRMIKESSITNILDLEDFYDVDIVSILADGSIFNFYFN